MNSMPFNPQFTEIKGQTSYPFKMISFFILNYMHISTSFQFQVKDIIRQTSDNASLQG